MATGEALQATAALAGGLRLDRERMRHNLDLTRGLIVSERVMLALGEHVGRQRAHDLVYEAAQRAPRGRHRVRGRAAGAARGSRQSATGATGGAARREPLRGPVRRLRPAMRRPRGAGRRGPACACRAGEELSDGPAVGIVAAAGGTTARFDLSRAGRRLSAQPAAPPPNSGRELSSVAGAGRRLGLELSGAVTGSG